LDPIAADGLTLGRSGKPTTTVVPDALTLTTDPRAAADADVVLVTTKSHDTETVARSAAAHLTPGTVTISLQNGLHNPARLRGILAGPVLAGVVTYNVVRAAPATYLQATSGELLVEGSPAGAPFARAAAAAGVPIGQRKDIVGVQHAKLLMNLNNAVNALSGRPLGEQLADRGYRRVLALCQEEALSAFAAAGVTPARLSPLPPSARVKVLRASDSIFTTMARTALKVHPDARSSMADDLAAGRRTEIDELQGAVVGLGAEHGVATPVNYRIAALVRAAEEDGPHDQTAWSSAELLEAVTF
jgi:2-dehydropantoate 2-reductase